LDAQRRHEKTEYAGPESSSRRNPLRLLGETQEDIPNGQENAQANHKSRRLEDTSAVNQKRI